MSIDNSYKKIKVENKEFNLRYKMKEEEIENIELNFEDIEKIIEEKLNSTKYIYIDIQREIINKHRFYAIINKEDKEYRIYAVFKVLEKNKENVLKKEFILRKDFNDNGIYLDIEFITEMKKER